ncbi:MAG TPA: ABC transporter permease, partial [Candidatus Hydrogenedentes bacterium]|nr:ABC transporter permease [Candidatus Hydrogenedentota bacterium]
MLYNVFILALRELRRNVMRSFLTMLGIIIGVGAVISLVTIGGGATKQVTEQLASLGSNLMMIAPGKRMGPGQEGSAPPFKLEDVETLLDELPMIRA